MLRQLSNIEIHFYNEDGIDEVREHWKERNRLRNRNISTSCPPPTLKERNDGRPKVDEPAIFEKVDGYVVVREDVDDVADDWPVRVILEDRMCTINHHVVGHPCFGSINQFSDG